MKNIELYEYNQDWLNYFDREKKLLFSSLPLSTLLHEVHHVGSTAVPGLCAKPKIDIIAVVALLDFDHTLFENLGYHYCGGFNIPFRKSFTKRRERGSAYDVNLHVFEQGDPEIELNLLFRDYLRTHDDERNAYAQLKKDILSNPQAHQKEGAFYRSYTLDKADFIKEIIKKAGFNRPRFLVCAHRDEQLAYHRIKEEQLYRPQGLLYAADDTIFTTSNNYCFVLVAGGLTVAIADVSLDSDHKKAIIQALATDKDYQNKGFGSYLLSCIERWLFLQKITIVSVKAPGNAESFFKKRGYSDLLQKNLAIELLIKKS